MKNYKVHFAEEERDGVINVISRSNDIVLNQVEPTSVFITIQLEDEPADILYEELLAQLDRELPSRRDVVGIVTEQPITDTPAV
jgi:hypothetical protein